VPVTFGAENDTIYIGIDHKPKTTTNLKRLRNIQLNPQVSVLADHYDEDWTALWWARADGRASIVDGGAELMGLLAAKYPQYREHRPDGPLIVIEVSRWSGWASSPP